MYNLLRFVKLYNFLLLFIIIEGFSILLLIKYNDFQGNKFFLLSKECTGKFYHIASSLSNYFYLKETNEYLLEENAKLYSILSKKEASLERESHLLKKTYIYESANVINNSVYKRNNYITLNKGSKHGIQEGMGVIIPNGIVGIVESVSKNYALVISILHEKSKISVLLEKQQIPGILKWKGFDYRAANIYDIPEHIKVEKGDTICSSGYSTIFPKGLKIGIVESLKKQNNGYYSILMSFFADLNTLNYVYIISSLNNKEQKELESNINE